MAANLLPAAAAAAPSTSTSLTPGSTSAARPELLYKFEGGSDDVNRAVLIPDSGAAKGVITISSDR